MKADVAFRAFVGGIGVGKSWIGAFDLIRRSKPGRLYMVVAPTYSMLQDATLRSFETLAREMDLIEEAKLSAPPSIKLTNGAEVLFRSADDPERLRGPNLSGIWMDEASLMGPSVFLILIGCLREGGEQGWLSATFTPKGKSHWTYETFATGRPDTALFHARTRDNPFLPPAFAQTLANQYTSHLAAQELEGLFIDAGGALFKREWFSVIDRQPQMIGRVRGWDLAGTPKDEHRVSHDPDYSVGVLLGKTVDRGYVVLDVRRKRGSPKEIESLVRATAEADGPGVHVVLEQEPGSSGVEVVDHYRREVLAGFVFHGERSTGSKSDRALPLAAMSEGGAVKLLRGGWNRDFLDEVEVFPFGRHDDQIDAMSLAFGRLAGKKTGRSEAPTILVSGPAWASPSIHGINSAGSGGFAVGPCRQGASNGRCRPQAKGSAPASRGMLRPSSGGVRHPVRHGVLGARDGEARDFGSAGLDAASDATDAGSDDAERSRSAAD
ncbi:MAG: phage terminase large subunit [Gemmataceae bacterium]|nr:phage terminase large subunit [Gemmataceae bacterium]